MKHRIGFCLAAAVAVLSTTGRADELELPLPTVQVESPEASPRPYGIGFAVRSSLAAGISTSGGVAAELGSAGNTEIRLEFAPGERLVFSVAAPLSGGSDGASADYVAGRAKLVLRSAENTPGAWDAAIAVGTARSSFESYRQSGNVEDSSTLDGSTTTVALVLGRHVGDGRSVLFGGPFYTAARYGGEFQHTTVTASTRYVAPGCALFFCWGGYSVTNYDYQVETTQVSGSARAMGVALGAARRSDRVRLAAQLAIAQVEDGAGSDTVALLTAGVDLFLGRPRKSGG